jgi:phosphoenolpyruvate-protein phosphotransferase
MTRHTLSGTPASAGIARGPWVLVQRVGEPVSRHIDAIDVAAETTRFRAAAAAAAAELEAIAQRVVADGHPEEGAIFDAQAEMARDPALATLVEQAISDRRLDAAGAVLQAAGDLAEQLRTLDDELLSARAADVIDVARRIARRASGIADPAPPTLQVPSIVVAEDLSPSVTATLPRDRLLGFALERGSATAHAAILARAYGIPAVVGVAGLLAALTRESGVAPQQLAIDGASGEVVIDPDQTSVADLDRRQRLLAQDDARARSEASLDAVTLDGVRVDLLANIGTPEESPRALEMGARGVGLFRTEFLFLERSTAPTEDEQTAAYREVVEAFAPHPVTIRLLDVGGDKPIPFLPMAPEANPFLGVRALRLAAEQPEVFLTQLRAAMRAAMAGPVKVMAPMVADATDAATLLRLAQEACVQLENRGEEFAAVDLGVMLEIPSAILVGETYFDRLAFASLGTNDLLQYTLAVDRGNPGLARYQDSLHPALLRLVREAVERAHDSGIELSVCGEMAGDPVAAIALVGLGIRKLSMAAGSLAPVRRALRGASNSDLRTEADAALHDDSAEAVRTRFKMLHKRTVARAAELGASH